MTVTVRPSESAPASAAMVVRTGGPAAAFASPSGRIVCMMLAGQFVRCEYVGGDAGWKVPVSNCQLHSGNVLYVDAKVAVGGCVGDTIADTPRVGTSYTTWWRSGDPTATLPGNGPKVAALPYGTRLDVTGFQCESAETGVTCRNSAGRGFAVSREQYRLF